MLARQYRIAKEKDFNRIFRNGRSFFSYLFKIKILKNNEDFSRFAVVISNKISKKAVVRNQLKRQITEIFRINLKNIKTGFDVVFIVKPAIVEKKFTEIKAEVLKGLAKTRLLKNL